MKVKNLLFYTLALFIFSENTTADIYRYQDKNGKWRYSDAVPPSEVKSEVVSVEKKPEDQKVEENTGEDLAAFLTEKVNPRSDIEKATLGVVKVETAYGTGSGFFVASSGYLITNKHVVRPGAFPQVIEEMEQLESKFKSTQSAWDSRAKELEQYKKQIDDYKKELESAPDVSLQRKREGNTIFTIEEYNLHNNRYGDMKKEYQQGKKEFDKAKEELAVRRNALNQSAYATTFKIIFKDGTEKKAKLVLLGKEQDLALLQIVGGYKTPYLEDEQRNTITQGAEVFAIGSPLGFKDYVTKGVITRHEQDRIVTDTEILPGNSGGPLVTPQGKVIGVNTQVYRSNGTLGSEVFGFAIPMDIVKKEFGARW